MFEIVVACNERMVIGKDNTIPWNVKEDLAMFKTLTTGHILVMGRKTYESLPVKPLKNRYNIVLTSEPDRYESKHDNLVFTNHENLDNILNNQMKKWGERVFVIGGSDIYKLFVDRCDKIHITVVDTLVDGDTYFPYALHDLRTIGFNLASSSNKVLSVSDNVTFQYRIYSR